MAASAMSATVGTTTPASAGCMWSSSSCRLRKYHGALEGFGVCAGLARSCSGALMTIARSVSVSVKSTAAMNSTKTRSGQTRSSSSRRLT